jgi:hypothetical protein
MYTVTSKDRIYASGGLFDLHRRPGWAQSEVPRQRPCHHRHPLLPRLRSRFRPSLKVHPLARLLRHRLHRGHRRGVTSQRATNPREHHPPNQCKERRSVISKVKLLTYINVMQERTDDILMAAGSRSCAEEG